MSLPRIFMNYFFIWIGIPHTHFWDDAICAGFLLLGYQMFYAIGRQQIIMAQIERKLSLQ